MVCENIFKALSIPNHNSWGAKILIKCSPPTMCHMSRVICQVSGVKCIFFFSKHQPSGPMLSISRNVHMCVCLFVCLSVCSLLRYRLTVFLPPPPEVGCPKLLEIRNPWGKVMVISGLIFEHFCLEVV